MKKLFKIAIYTTASLALISIIAMAILFLSVYRDANDQIRSGAIENIISSESPVYYNDGSTPIGVFFEKIHSKYVEYDDLPRLYIKALIASEDHGFFEHSGFDIRAIIRAAVANIKAGRIVQGGSTLSQQTAQNVFQREKRGFVSQLKELFRALILEFSYTKEEILEMYVNQFEVTGFGKGVRIASEYFFDKELKDLDLVETAFIAGMLNAPRKYDPFTKRSEETKHVAIEHARRRKDSVLSNMRKLNFITDEEYKEAAKKGVPFKEGKITYRLDVILDYIREQLESDYFKNILHEQGVDNIATSGIRIHTSVSQEMQKAAIESVRRNLSTLDVKLAGYNKNLMQGRYATKNGLIYSDHREGFPFFAEITGIRRDLNDPAITVKWKNGEGVIDAEGLNPMAQAWIEWKSGSNARLDSASTIEFLKLFEEGDSIPVLAVNDTGQDGKLILWEIPELEGGVVVLKDGMIKAMVGGFFNRYFNRAANAKRQLGSIFKPLVYAAALQLKWHELDELSNRTDLFTFTNTPYVPRPDHSPKSDKVSMTWAGVKSENLATVWLLYHLTDRLNMSEFREVAEKLALTRGRHESYNDYVERIRDTYGVVVDRDSIQQAAFDEAKKTIEADLIFGDYEDALENVSRISLSIDTSKLENVETDYSELERYEFKRLTGMNSRMEKRLSDLQTILTLYESDKTAIAEKTADIRKYFFISESHLSPVRIIYDEAPEGGYSSDHLDISIEDLTSESLKIDSRYVWIDNILPSGVISLLESHRTIHLKDFANFSRYDINLLSKIRDFRTLVNLQYVKQLAHELGISTTLDPVLSFPLGPNAITILEAAQAYQSIMTGTLFTIEPEINSPEMVPIITRIVDRNGVTIWEYEKRPQKVLSKRVTSSLIEMLRMVVEEGTGRRARGSIQMSVGFENGKMEIPVPCFGKTGTANRFTNSSFIGFIPGLDPESGEFDTQEGYVIASYVGYDDNAPMKGPNIRIAGASGALPVWIDTSSGVAGSPEYKKNIHVPDLAFLDWSKPLISGNNMQPVRVSGISGLRAEESSEEFSTDQMVETWSFIVKNGSFINAAREFDPIEGVPHE